MTPMPSKGCAGLGSQRKKKSNAKPTLLLVKCVVSSALIFDFGETFVFLFSSHSRWEIKRARRRENKAHFQGTGFECRICTFRGFVYHFSTSKTAWDHTGATMRVLAVKRNHVKLCKNRTSSSCVCSMRTGPPSRVIPGYQRLRRWHRVYRQRFLRIRF